MKRRKLASQATQAAPPSAPEAVDQRCPENHLVPAGADFCTVCGVYVHGSAPTDADLIRDAARAIRESLDAPANAVQGQVTVTFARLRFEAISRALEETLGLREELGRLHARCASLEANLHDLVRSERGRHHKAMAFLRDSRGSPSLKRYRGTIEILLGGKLPKKLPRVDPELVAIDWYFLVKRPGTHTLQNALQRARGVPSLVVKNCPVAPSEAIALLAKHYGFSSHATVCDLLLRYRARRRDEIAARRVARSKIDEALDLTPRPPRYRRVRAATESARSLR